ncbi:MAG: TonB-dependent receptor [Sphingomicrobium sp.]
MRPCRFRVLAMFAAGWSTLSVPPARAQEAPGLRSTQADEALPDRGLEDIIITARRRPEPLQRTPVSVVTMSKEDLESRSVTNLRSLQNFVPNLTFAPSQNVGEAAANVFIRGIGQEDFGVGAEAGVGFYVDGVYFARSLGMMMSLVDVDRIEVLRGPQGTLYGKDAIGGAINVISTQPQARADRTASATLGNFGRVELRSVVNEPLSNRLFLRLAVSAVSRGGYLQRLTPLAPLDLIEQANGRPVDLRPEGAEHSQGARLQLRWLITNSLTADVTIDGSRIRNTQGAIHVDRINPNFGDFPDINELIREGRLPGPEITNALAPVNLLQSYATGSNLTHQELWGISTVLTQSLGASTLKFIGAYRSLRSHVGTDDDGLYFDVVGSDFRVRQHQLSGELQLSGVAGRLNYTTGLYAFGERPRILPGQTITAVLYTCNCAAPDVRPELTSDTRQLRTTSYAGYIQATYRLTNRLSATLGARYTHERKRLEGAEFLLNADLQPTTLVATGHSDDSWNSFTYRGDAQYQATPDLMVYGSVARGFKSGGFNVRGEASLPNLGFAPFDPETAVTFEVGLRSEWLHRKLRLNATLFDTEYRDIQLRQQTVIAGMDTTLIENAARARIRGAEVELTATPLKGLMLTAAYGHLDPKYLDVGRVRGLTLNSRFQRTPRNSFTVSGNYELPVRSTTLELHGDYSYRSKEQFQIVPAINDQPGYGLLGARLTLRSRNSHWSVALFGTNLADVRYRTAGRGTLINQAGFAYSSVGIPRQFGLQITAF